MSGCVVRQPSSSRRSRLFRSAQFVAGHCFFYPFGILFALTFFPPFDGMNSRQKRATIVVFRCSSPLSPRQSDRVERCSNKFKTKKNLWLAPRTNTPTHLTLFCRTITFTFLIFP